MRRDRGVTIVEVTATIAVIGVLSVVLLGGIAVLLRTNPVVTNAIAENHDEQQLTNYLYGDVRSTSAVEVAADDALGYSRRVGAAGCPGNPGLNVLQLTWSNGAHYERASYRLVATPEGTRLDRYLCGGDSIAAMVTTSRVNIADALDAVPDGWNGAGSPAEAVVDGGLVSLRLYQAGRNLTMAAALQSFGARPATPPVTTVAPTLPTTTTTTTVPPTTTTTVAPTLPPTTTTAPPPPDLLCSLLANIGAVLQAPATAATLLREFGVDGVAGVLSSTAQVTATVSVGLGLGLPGISLTLSLCAAVQLSYNTGTTDVVVPMRAEPTCTEWNVLRVLCLKASVKLSVDLEVTPYQTWTDGPHALQLRTAAGVVAGSTASVLVQVNPASVPTTTTTTTLPPVTVPPAAGPINPLTPARGFSVMTAGNATLVSSEVKGAVAVGATFAFRNWFDVASSASSSLTLPGETGTTGLLVGGNIDLGASSGGNLEVGHGYVHSGTLTNAVARLHGSAMHVVRAGTATNDDWSTPRVIVSAVQTNPADAVSKPGAFPFENSFVLMNHYARRMGQLDPATCAGVVFPQFYEQQNSPNNWVLHLVKNKVNVLNVTSAQLARITGVSGSQHPAADTPLVVNVTDAGPVTIPATWWPQWQNGDKSSIIWNVANSTSVTVSGSTLYGSLYAPSAAVTLTNVQVMGDVVAASLTTNGGSIQLQHFSGTVPCVV